MLSVKPDRPVAPLTVAVMREVDVLAKELKLTYFVCGAMARDILLQHIYGIDTGIATADDPIAAAERLLEQFKAGLTGK